MNQHRTQEPFRRSLMSIRAERIESARASVADMRIRRRQLRRFDALYRLHEKADMAAMMRQLRVLAEAGLAAGCGW